MIFVDIIEQSFYNQILFFYLIIIIIILISLNHSTFKLFVIQAIVSIKLYFNQ